MNTFRAVCFGKYLRCFKQITDAVLAVDDYRMKNGGQWKDLNFKNRYPEPPPKIKKRREFFYTKNLCYTDKALSYLYSKVRVNAQNRNLEFSIERNDLFNLWKKQQSNCALTGRQMTFEKGGLWSSASVDRIDSKLGYTKDNIQLVCVGVNRAKLNLPDAEFIRMCSDVVKYRKNNDG